MNMTNSVKWQHAFPDLRHLTVVVAFFEGMGYSGAPCYSINEQLQVFQHVLKQKVLPLTPKKVDVVVDKVVCAFPGLDNHSADCVHEFSEMIAEAVKDMVLRKP